MEKEKKVRVVIPYSGKIPTIGKGPINNPIYIDEEVFNMLKTLGINIKKVDEQPIPSKIVIENKQKEEIEKNEEVLENNDVNDTNNDTERENIFINNEEENSGETDEISEQECTEVRIEDNNNEGKTEIEEEIVKENEEEETVFEIETATKKQLIAELIRLNIPYEKKMNVETLRNLLTQYQQQ